MFDLYGEIAELLEKYPDPWKTACLSLNKRILRPGPAPVRGRGGQQGPRMPGAGQHAGLRMGKDRGRFLCQCWLV
jgi:hypothetical protein